MDISNEIGRELGINFKCWQETHRLKEYFPRAVYPFYSYGYFIEKVIGPHKSFLKSFSREIFAKIILPYSSLMDNEFNGWGTELRRSVILADGEILEVDVRKDKPISVLSTIASSFGKLEELQFFLADLMAFAQERKKDEKAIIVTSNPLEFYSLGFERYLYENESRIVLPYKAVIVNESNLEYKIHENTLPDFVIETVCGPNLNIGKKEGVLQYVYF